MYRRGFSAVLAVVLVIGSYFLVNELRYRAARQSLIEMGITISDTPGIGEVIVFPDKAKQQLLEKSIEYIWTISDRIRSINLSKGVFVDRNNINILLADRNNIHDLAALEELTQLQYLSLDNTQVSDLAVLELKKTLPQTQIVTEDIEPR